MKKILGIMGSPRKNGNTDVLVSRILEGARYSGATTDKISLVDLDITECDGCHVCWKGKHVCSKEDDMRDLYPAIVEADALVLGTPVYWFGPTAILKAFFDRFVYFNCPATRKKIRNKAVVLAVPFADRTSETSDPVVDFFARSLDYLEMRLVGRILVPGVTKPGEVRAREPVMTACYDLGRRLAAPGQLGTS